jgi:predicted ArsR family transcriptional regulator
VVQEGNPDTLLPLAGPQLAFLRELRHTYVVKKMPAGEVEDPRTRDLVARSILENGPMSAVVLAEKLGFTPAGIRRHLDSLVAEGLLVAREPHILNGRGRGRPSKVFVMSDVGREKFEHSYDDLAVAALKFMQAQMGPEALMGFANARATEIERTSSPIIDSERSPAARVDALAKFLTTEGYAASVLPRSSASIIARSPTSLLNFQSCAKPKPRRFRVFLAPMFSVWQLSLTAMVSAPPTFQMFHTHQQREEVDDNYASRTRGPGKIRVRLV